MFARILSGTQFKYRSLRRTVAGALGFTGLRVFSCQLKILIEPIQCSSWVPNSVCRRNGGTALLDVLFTDI